MYSPHFYNGVIESEEFIQPDDLNSQSIGLLPAAVRLCLLALQGTVIRGWLTAGEVGKLVKMHPYNAAIVLSKCFDYGCVVRGSGPAGKYYKITERGVHWLRKMFADAYTTIAMFDQAGMFRAVVTYDMSGHVQRVRDVVACTEDTAVLPSTVAADMLAHCNHAAMLSEPVGRLLHDILHYLPAVHNVSQFFELVGRDSLLTSPWRTMFIDNELDCYTLARWLSYHLFHSSNPLPTGVNLTAVYRVWPQWNQHVTSVMINKLPARISGDV